MSFKPRFSTFLMEIELASELLDYKMNAKEDKENIK